MKQANSSNPIIEALTIVTLQGTSAYWVGREGVTKILDFSDQDSVYFNEFRIYSGDDLIGKVKNVPVHIRYKKENKQ